MKKYKIMSLIIMVFILSCNSNEDNMKIVEHLDINRFMGDWYVIGIIPNFIEKEAENGVESYRLNNKGNVDIQYNFQKNGKVKTMNAKGFLQDTSNAFWKVQFLWPVKLPYLVIDLAEDYSYTVVGVPNKKFVWIMAREPEIEDELYQEILNRLKSTGYDITQIKRMKQSW